MGMFSLFSNKNTDLQTRKNLAKVVRKLQDRPFAMILCDSDRLKKSFDFMDYVNRRTFVQDMKEKLDIINHDADFSGILRDKEYICIVSDKSVEEIHDRAVEMSAVFSRPFFTGTCSILLTASIGWSLSPNDGMDVSKLLRKADEALRYAKLQGGDHICRYNSDLSASIARKKSIMQKLQNGIFANKFEPWFQPRMLVEYDGTRCVGAEALTRWRGETVGPDEFIPIAEQCGMIMELGEIILLKACMALRTWENEFGNDAPVVSVNVSPWQFSSCFVETIERIITSTHVSPHKLELEITESQKMIMSTEIRNILFKISRMGILLAVDDFGTGFSSYSYLKTLPVNTLKLDSSFVTNIVTKRTDQVIVESIAHMAHATGLNLVVEGVETREQLELLVSRGCREIQGYYFSRPLPADVFLAWLKKEQKQENLECELILN